MSGNNFPNQNKQSKSVWINSHVVSISFLADGYNVARDKARQIARAIQQSVLGDKWHENHLPFLAFVGNNKLGNRKTNTWTFYLFIESRISSIKLNRAIVVAKSHCPFVEANIEWQAVDEITLNVIHLLLKNIQSGKIPDYEWIVKSKSLLKL